MSNVDYSYTLDFLSLFGIIYLIQQVKLFPQGEIVKMLLCERFTLINLVQWLNIRTDNDYPCLIAIGQDNICRHTNKFITI
jgi:hypothetical protein